MDPGRDFWGLALVGFPPPGASPKQLSPEGFEEAEELRGLLANLEGRLPSLLRSVPPELRPRFERALALSPVRPPLWISSSSRGSAFDLLEGLRSSGLLGRTFVGDRGRRFWDLRGFEPVWVREDFSSAVAQSLLFGGALGWLRRALSGRRLDGVSAYLIALLGIVDLEGI